MSAATNALALPEICREMLPTPGPNSLCWPGSIFATRRPRRQEFDMARYDNILQTIGHTPAVKLNRLCPPHVEVYMKVEAFNPGGSVKDRMARAIIEDAEQRGALKPGQTVVEATSGNTGIGLAMVCAQKGYPLVVTMVESFSVERRRLMRFLGAKVVLTPASEKGSGMLAKAIELAETHGWFLCRQFENEANARVHSETTAREILADFADAPLDYFVTGFGTGGTLKGVARRLKAESPMTKIVACEPDNAPLLGSGIPQARGADGAHTESHPMFRPHLMQGWSPDFISKLLDDAMREGLVDEVLPVNGERALEVTRALAREEGIFAGISGGATLAAALAIAERAPQGSRILCMLPDTGERYLSTPLFADICEEMDAEEMAISKSTPGFRFDVRSAPAPGVAADTPGEEPVLDAEAASFVAQVLADPEQPVVMFALEWCEFSWSARKLFARLRVPYRTVDLDSVTYQENDRGGKIRAVLKARIGIPTIPQIFVAGTHVGGCTELFDAYQDGRLATLLEQSGAPLDTQERINPYELLPGWVHPRQNM
jgi:cysteine synthase